MARIYANLILMGLKTIDDVPAHIKLKVEKIMQDDLNQQDNTCLEARYD